MNSTRILENRFSDMTSAIRYEDGVIAWAAEQAGLLRKGRLDQLDREHLAEEIEDVGKSEQRELVGRMTRFWRTSSSGSRATGTPRRKLANHHPRLRPKLAEPDWWAGVWDDATAQVAEETGLSDFPFDHSLQLYYADIPVIDTDECLRKRHLLPYVPKWPQPICFVGSEGSRSGSGVRGSTYA